MSPETGLGKGDAPLKNAPKQSHQLTEQCLRKLPKCANVANQPQNNLEK